MQSVARVLMAITIGVATGVAAGSSTVDYFYAKALVDAGVREFTQVPEYQGVGFAALLYGALVFFAVGAAVSASLWVFLRRTVWPKAQD